MTPEDIQYLRAELYVAQKEGLVSTMVRVSELQSLLDRMTRALDAAPDGVEIMGFVRQVEAQEFKRGHLPRIVVRRSPTRYHKEPLYNREELMS